MVTQTVKPAKSEKPAKPKKDRSALLAASMELDVGAPQPDSERRFALAAKLFEGPPSGADSVTGNVIMLLIEDIEDNPYNARQVYLPEVIRERSASLATNGQLSPAIVTPISGKPGKYYLVDGKYRKLGLIALGKPEMRCEIREGLTMLDLYRLSFITNEERNGQTAIDNALAWHKLLTENVVSTQQELVPLTGVNETTIAKTLSILHLPQETIDLIEAYPDQFGLNICYELNLYLKITDASAVFELAKRVQAEELSFREVKEIRDRAENGRTRKKRETSRQYKISHGGKGSLKEFDSGRLVLDVKLSDAAKIKVIKDYLMNELRIGEGEPTE